MRRLALALLLALPLFASAPDNDDTCDVGLFPAATLLLPYFEVDLDDRQGETTLFTITNVTSHEQIAHVTLWTDYAFPVLDFEIFLTGYDVQSINLYDVIGMGDIAPPSGTGYNDLGSSEGDFSSDEANPLVDELTCRALPGNVGPEMRERLRRAFTQGVAGECTTAGGVHANAVGYATIDVVRHCNAPHAQEPGFIEALLFDNALIGEYQQVHSSQNYAQGGSLVHIRALPEGGGETPLQRTFYSAYQTGKNRTRDGRQPLPSTFAAHWIDGGPGEFETKLKIWRESESGGVRACDVYPVNGEMPVTEIVRFDQDGELVTFDDDESLLPATSLLEVNGDTAGWIYLNLGKQAWVVSSMRAERTYSVDVEATALGNGCSPAFEPHAPIGPAPNLNLAPGPTNNDDTCDIAVLPAATLLLPYFEVDTRSLRGENTLITVTNVSAEERIAHVTLWTDFAFPVVSFDVVLGGYDTRSISLYDLLMTGNIGASCAGFPVTLPESMRERVREALIAGRIPGDAACSRIGSSSHRNSNAAGYATIDVVSSCTTLDPANPQYYTAAIGFENVLTGDYQQIHPSLQMAQGAPLVHIRAIPEGGNRGTLPSTFYGRFQPASNPTGDARQPLPSLFAARWIEGGLGSFETFFNIWREAKTGADAACSAYGANAVMTYMDLVIADDEENLNGFAPEAPAPFPVTVGFPATGRWGVRDGDFPEIADALSGWMYLNLGDGDRLTTPARQAWVTTSMRAQERFAVDTDAAALGNGCTPAVPLSEVNGVPGIEIGPAPNRNQP